MTCALKQSECDRIWRAINQQSPMFIAALPRPRTFLCRLQRPIGWRWKKPTPLWLGPSTKLSAIRILEMVNTKGQHIENTTVHIAELKSVLLYRTFVLLAMPRSVWTGNCWKSRCILCSSLCFFDEKMGPTRACVCCAATQISLSRIVGVA